MKNFNLRRAITLMTVVVLLAGTGCGENQKRAFGRQETEDISGAVYTVDTAMGTIFTQNVDMGAQSAQLEQEILTAVKELEEQELSWRLENSEVYRLNEAGGGELSNELEEILVQCLELSEATDGAFDVTVGVLGRLWDIDSRAAKGQEGGNDTLPTGEDIAQALESVGYQKLSLTKHSLTLDNGIQLDLGSVGKGIALDRAGSILDTCKEGAGSAVISAGGSVLTYGSKRDGSAWHVAVVDPMEPAQFLGYLEVWGTCFISTSGDYERYVEVDGQRYCHILDPKTGYPVDGSIHSVTIMAGNGLLSDALSTACLLLGTEKGLELAGRYGAEALFVERDGNIVMTEGMREVFRAADQ